MVGCQILSTGIRTLVSCGVLLIKVFFWRKSPKIERKTSRIQCRSDRDGGSFTVKEGVSTNPIEAIGTSEPIGREER